MFIPTNGRRVSSFFFFEDFTATYIFHHTQILTCLFSLFPKTLNYMYLTFQSFDFNAWPDEGYYRRASYLMKVITEERRTWWRLIQKNVVPDEGYYRRTSYLMKVITEERRT
jgi:hypothetical protein